MKKLVMVAAFVMLLLTPLAAQVDPQAPLENDPAVRKGKLENGLTYYVRHNPKPENRAEFYICTNVGALEENEKQDGLAHFLEHMAFNGLKSLPGKQMFTYLEGIGAKFGENINAMTGVEFTSYMLNNIPLRSEGVIDTCLMILHDWSCNIENLDSEINAERPVIIEELRQGQNASRRMREASMKYLYGDSKYATTNIIGTVEGLETFDPQSLRDFYATWYRPDLQAIIVVGDIDVDDIEAKIKSRFSDLKTPENAQQKVLHKIPGNEEPIIGIVTDPEAKYNQLSVYYKSEPVPYEYRNTGVAYLNDLMQGLVSMMLSERLAELPMKPDSPVLGAYAGFSSLTRTCDVFNTVVVSPDSRLDEGFRSLMMEMEKAKRYGFTEDELARAKEKIVKSSEVAVDRMDSRQNSEFIWGYINNFLSNDPYMDPVYEKQQVEFYLSLISTENINMVLPATMTENNMVILVNAPEKEGNVLPDEAEIKSVLEEVRNADIEAPAADKALGDLMDPSTVKAGKIKKVSEGIYGSEIWKLSNGMEVIYKHTENSKGSFRMSMTVNGGMSLVSDELMAKNVNSVYSFYLDNAGLAEFSATDLPKVLSGKRAYAGISIGSTEHGWYAGGSNKDAETAFQLLYLNIMEPRFDQQAFDISKEQLRIALESAEKLPQTEMQRKLNKLLYDSPRKAVLDKNVLESVTLDDTKEMLSLFTENFKGGKLFITGDIDRELAMELVKKYVASLPSGKKPLEWSDRGDGIVKTSATSDFSVRMETPKATVIQFYTADAKDLSPKTRLDFNALEYALNMTYIKTLREEEGGTYGAGVSIGFIINPEKRITLQVYFDTQAEKADRLIEVAKQGLKDIAENGISDEYLLKIRENFRKSYSESQISDDYWSYVMRNYYLYGTDMQEGYLENVDALTSDDVKNAAAYLLENGNLLELVMRPEAK